MSIELERERLSQTKSLAHFRREMSLAEKVTVDQLWVWRRECSHFIRCVIMPSSQVARILSSREWAFPDEEGMPSVVETYGDNEKQERYLRFGNDDGIEPLVINRSFHGLRDSYAEICEEFRHYYNLYHDDRDKNIDRYVKIKENGDEQTIAVVDHKCASVQIRLREIREFLSVKNMHLAIEFYCQEFSGKSLEELGLSEGSRESREGLSRWRFNLCESESLGPDRRIMSSLRVYRFIEPLPRSKRGFAALGEGSREKYVEFIIEMDEDGEEVEHTCDPDVLDGNESKPGAIGYLTRVDFQKQVLDEYYRDSRYEISSGNLSCGGLWRIPIDDQHDDKICVWLGDLGRLPYEEQLHWRRHNIVSESSVSESYYRRQILAEFTSSNRPEHRFQHSYGELARECQEHLGWPLLLPLEDGDKYHLDNIRIPAADEQQHFDELVLGLTKILIDSLNERELKKLISPDQRTDLTGSIRRLEAALAACDCQDAEEHITFLRNLQALRSAGSGHRKGRKYHKAIAPFTANSRDLRTVFADILAEAILFLGYLIEFARSRPGHQG